MDDLISRHAAIKALMAAVDDVGVLDKEDIKKVLDMLPTAQPELKRGKWINDGGLYKCSYCNQLWAEWWAISKPIERMRKEMAYCPMCGSYNGEEN